MRTVRLLPTITEKRIEWLQKLARDGIGNRNSAVGYHTMKLDWTQWAYTDGAETISEEEFYRRFPRGDHSIENDPKWEVLAKAREIWNICGEMLTDAGRNVLADYRKETAP